MRVEKVILHNFGSYLGPHQFDVGSRGLTFVIGTNLDEPSMESNGSGKSTLWNSIDWGLFGKDPKGDSLSAVVSDEAGKNCWVLVFLTDGDDEYVIFRYRECSDGHGVKVYKNGTNLTAMDTKETQSIIEELIGLDQQIYRSTVYQAQTGAFDFADATDAKRKELLSGIIHELGELDAMRERLAGVISAHQNGFAEIESRARVLETRISELSAINWDEQRTHWEAQQAETIRTYESALHKAECAHRDALNETIHIDLLQDQIRDYKEVTADAYVSVFADSQATYRHELDMWLGMRGQTQAAKALFEREIESIKSGMESVCSKCGQEVDQSHREQMLAELVPKLKVTLDNLSVIAGKIQAAEAQLSRLKEMDQKAIADWNASRSETIQKLGAAQSELIRLQRIDTESLLANVDRARTALQAAKDSEWPMATRAEESLARLAQAKKDLESLGAERAGHAEKLEMYQWWKSALGNGGLKSYVLDNKIQVMSDESNKWLGKLTNGTMRVQFETQSETKSGKLNEKFNIRVFKHNPDGTITERTYRSLSGGEQRRVSLSVGMGLSKLVEQRAAKQWDLYVVDESFRKHLDSKGRDAVFEILKDLQQSKSSIFVIDHDKEMASNFESVVEVQIKNRRSTIVGAPKLQESSPAFYYEPLDGGSVH